MKIEKMIDKYLNEAGNLPKRIELFDPKNRKKVESYLKSLGFNPTEKNIDQFFGQYGALITMLKSMSG